MFESISRIHCPPDYMVGYGNRKCFEYEGRDFENTDDVTLVSIGKFSGEPSARIDSIGHLRRVGPVLCSLSQSLLK